MMFVVSLPMQNERTEGQLKLVELNKKFLAEVEKGADWAKVKYILDEMRAVARDIEKIRQPATVISMDNFHPSEKEQQINR